MSSPSNFRALDFRLAPEYRRCGIYVAVAFVVIAAILVGFTWAGINDRTWERSIIVLTAFAVGTLFLLVAIFRYRIQIDEHGVWRRRFVRWDLWPWDAFEQGKVRHGKGGDQLTFPEKSWYWRTISASALGERDRAAYETVVRRYRVAPSSPPVPDVLDLKLPLRARLALSADGVQWRSGRHDDGELVRWPDVVRVEVIRATHDRPDFVTLELYLPDQPKPVRLTHNKGAPMWSGADAEVIALYLRRHLEAAGRFQVTALRGPPADLAESDRRLTRLDASERDLRRANRFIRHMFVWCGLILWAVWFDLWNRPNPLNWVRADWLDAAKGAGATVALLGFYGVKFFGIAFFQKRDLRRDRDKILRWRAGQVWA